jgi:hypothetical protein
MRAEVAHITFGASRGREALHIYKPETVKVDKSWRLLTDVAVITMARNVIDFDKENVNEVFKVGDPVQIELGYNGEYYTEFIGFISIVSADIPIKIFCEDAMWKLKQLPAHISLKETTLQNLLQQLVTGYTVDALEIDMGTVRYADQTVAKVLDSLRSKYGFFSYMQGQTLVVGKIYGDDSDLVPINLHLERNVQRNNLEYRNAGEIKIKIKAVATLPDGKKIQVEVGADGGESMRLPYFGITSEESLLKIAELDYTKYNVDGFHGSVTTFGIPAIEHGNKVNLSSDLYKDREGLYYVESVSVLFGGSYKYQRKVTLGDKTV